VDLFPFLQQSPLLAGFSDDGIKIIQSVCVARQIEVASPIFVEKIHGESAFLLVAGEVSISVERNGSQRELAVLTAPDVFGEVSLLQPGPRRVTARARTPVGVIEIPRRDFLNLQKARPQACLKLLMNVTDRLALRLQETAPLLDRLIDQV
jgi:CRP/FNR family cyclic AMP-dependent transcriptional regulator